MVSFTNFLALLVSAAPTLPASPIPRKLVFEMLGGLMIFFGLLAIGVYVWHRIFRGLREDYSKGEHFPEPKPSVSDSPAFAAAAFQGVLKELREREKEQERLRLGERQRAEKSEQRLAAFMDNLPAGLLLLSRDGRITECNSAAKSLLGHELLVGRGFPEVFSPDSGPDSEGAQPLPPATAGLEECLRTGNTAHLQITYRSPGGRRVLLRIDFAALRAAEGSIEGVLCLLTDLTHLTPPTEGNGASRS